jgi:hypothetical protein
MNKNVGSDNAHLQRREQVHHRYNKTVYDRHGICVELEYAVNKNNGVDDYTQHYVNHAEIRP